MTGTICLLSAGSAKDLTFACLCSLILANADASAMPTLRQASEHFLNERMTLPTYPWQSPPRRVRRSKSVSPVACAYTPLPTMLTRQRRS